MRFPKTWLTLSLVVGLALAGRTACARGSLSTDFGNVALENIPQGTPFELAGRPVRITNGGDYPIGVVCEAVLPTAKDMVPGYEPVPDPGWISFAPKAFRDVAPGATVSAVMTIAVPKDAMYAGKRYEAYLFLHTSADTAGAVGMGVKPRLLFKVADPGADVTVKAAPEIPVSLTPEISAGGTAYWGLLAQPLVVENKSDQPMLFEFGVAGSGPAADVPLKEGREALPAGASLVAVPGSLQLGPHSTAEVAVLVQLPAEGAFAGRKLQGTLRTRVHHRESAMTILTAVLVDVPAVKKGGRNAR
jgi:hypothetical protein